MNVHVAASEMVCCVVFLAAYGFRVNYYIERSVNDTYNLNLHHTPTISMTQISFCVKSTCKLDLDSLIGS